MASEQGEIQDQVVLGRTQTKHSTSVHHQSFLLTHCVMIKPFKIINITELEDGTRRVEYSVKKSERTECGVRIHELKSVVFASPDVDVDDYLFGELKKQGWF